MNVLVQLCKVLVLLLLPFLVLIRASVFFHDHYFASPWISLLSGLVLTAFLLFLYFTFFYGRLTGQFGNIESIRRRALIALLLVAVYALHGVLFIKSKNLKTSSLKNEFLEVHPVLRLSVSTLIWIDPSLLLTDASREIEDYDSMGLKRNKNSLHLKQKTSNYVHAIDIRTKGRSEWKNKSLEYYFWAMGFNTIRHKGTADHLHISISSRDRVGKK